MKKILLVLFLFLSVRCFAQIPDSVISIYNSARTNSWIQIGSPPSGFTVDTMFVMPISGQNYLMKDYNKGSFTTRELGIFPSVNSNLYRLQKAANHDSIKQITLDQFGGGIYKMAGTLNLNGKTLSKIGDSRLVGMTGADTIENGVIEVSILTQLVDTNITFKNCKFVNNVSPAIYGADLSGTILSTRAFIKTVAIEGVAIVLPKNSIIRIDSTATVARTSDYFGALGVVRMSNYTMTPLLFGGTVAGTASKRTYEVNTESDLITPTLTQWNSSNFIGAIFRNMNSCKINIVSAVGFREGFRFIGDNAGFSYNTIYSAGEAMQNNKIDFRMTQKGTGWCNENELVGIPRCFVNTGVLTSQARYGLIIDNDSTSNYQNNSNKITGLSVEKGINCIPILIKDGFRNFISDIRSEDNSSVDVVFSGSADENFVTASYNGNNNTYIDTSSRGTNIYVNSTSRKTSTNTSIVQVYSWQAQSHQYDGTTVAISGANIINSTNGAIIVSSNQVLSYPKYVEISGNTPGIGFNKLVTSSDKIFSIKRQVEAGFAGRIKFFLYDSSGRDLTNTVTPQSNTSLTFSGGGWVSGANSSSEVWLRTPASVSFVTIVNARSGSNVRLKSFSLSVVTPAQNSVSIGGVTMTKIAIAKPSTLGTYAVGDVIQNVGSDTTVGSWVCDTAGTLRAISVAGTVTGTSRNLVLASGHGIAAGEWLQLNTRIQVDGIAGDTAYLAVASTAFSGTVTNAPANLRAVRSGGGSSGGGITALTGEVTASGIGSVAATISNNAVTYGKMQQSVGTSVVGRSANSTGNVAAISTSTDGETLRRIGGVLGFGLLPWASIFNVPNYYFTNPNLPDTNLVKLNDSTFLVKANRAPDTSVMKHTDTTTFFKLQSGVYSPSRSDPTNVASSSVESFFFERNGKVVGFSGTLRVTPTSASPATTALDLALPLSPTFTATTDLGASGSVTTPAVTGNSWTFLINGRTSNGTARVSFTSTGNTEHVIFITGRFELK